MAFIRGQQIMGRTTNSWDTRNAAVQPCRYNPRPYRPQIYWLGSRVARFLFFLSSHFLSGRRSLDSYWTPSLSSQSPSPPDSCCWEMSGQAGRKTTRLPACAAHPIPLLNSVSAWGGRYHNLLVDAGLDKRDRDDSLGLMEG
jgi:hypothetical protein